VSLNVVVISGRLGKDPEVRSTSGGKSVCTFSIAVDRGYGDKKKTVWVSVEAWDKTAEAVARLVTKGKRVEVTGELDEDSWTDQSGQKKSRFKVIARKVDIIDFPETGGSAPSTSDISDGDDVPF
jgi:single-strand DNA-binding protein